MISDSIHLQWIDYTILATYIFFVLGIGWAIARYIRAMLCAQSPLALPILSFRRLHFVLILLGCFCFPAIAQIRDVPIQDDNAFTERVELSAKKLREQNRLATFESFKSQMARATCQLELPPTHTQPLDPVQICQRARQAMLGIGSIYLCQNCDNWHASIAGGYAITSDGIAATCYHVLQKQPNMREGYFVAVDADGNVFPVTEVLAANAKADVALVRTEAKDRIPLPLNPQLAPGSPAFCLSNPQDVREFFSAGIFSRYFYDGPDTVSLNVTTEWATGSSGSAILDACGNAIGHVAATRTILSDSKKQKPADVQMTLKIGSSAREILKLCTQQ